MNRSYFLEAYLFSRRRYKHCLGHSKHIRKPYMKINKLNIFFFVELHEIVKYTNLGLSLDGFFFLYSSSNFWAFNCCFLISRSSSKAPSKKINNSCDIAQQKKLFQNIHTFIAIFFDGLKFIFIQDTMSNKETIIFIVFVCTFGSLFFILKR